VTAFGGKAEILAQPLVAWHYVAIWQYIVRDFREKSQAFASSQSE
jgi:hypothetical protein